MKYWSRLLSDGTCVCMKFYQFSCGIIDLNKATLDSICNEINLNETKTIL